MREPDAPSPSWYQPPAPLEHRVDCPCHEDYNPLHWGTPDDIDRDECQCDSLDEGDWRYPHGRRMR